MDVSWPYKRRELGDTITYGCPNNRLTWVEGARSVSQGVSDYNDDVS